MCPMGIVSDEDFNKEISNSHVTVDKSVTPKPTSEVIDIQKGRGEGKKETPDEIRRLVGISAVNGEGTGAEIASAFNVSESSVSAYKVGSTSTASYHQPQESLLDSLNNHKAKISKKARARLMSALNSITPEKLEGVKARDLAAIAKDMSAIITDMEPQINPNVQQGNNVQFVFMAPRVRDLESFKIIDLAE